MIEQAIIKLSQNETLSYETAKDVMDEIMGGIASDVQISSYLTALAIKGETIEEITASAASMREHCVRLLHDMEVLEIVGTGGDQSNSFNISTTSSIVIASGDVPVAKHGNRAASSLSGSADVLEALGVNISITPKRSKEILEEIGICFLFAQKYHLAMKYVAGVRKELRFRTIFNILGPLSNPAGATMQVMGVYDEKLVKPLAKVLCNLGVKRAMVVYGQDKLDEISMSAPTTVCEVKDGAYESYEITPEQFGYVRCEKAALVGGAPEENASITKAILEGEKGDCRNAVCLNAGAGLYIAGKTDTLVEGVRLAEKLLDSGAAHEKLEAFIRCSNEEKIDA
ncbi:MAG: anthranilate phosphoribosyltransferase [Eubacteriales bacterium]